MTHSIYNYAAHAQQQVPILLALQAINMNSKQNTKLKENIILLKLFWRWLSIVTITPIECFISFDLEAIYDTKVKDKYELKH